MATVIDELGQVCAQLPGIEVEMQPADMLVTLPLSNGRQQTVKVWTVQSPNGGPPTIRMQSRAGLVRHHKLIRDALYHNAKPELAGFALDLSVNPPALDVICGIVAHPQALPVQDFLNALFIVAAFADETESKLGTGADRF